MKDLIASLDASSNQIALQAVARICGLSPSCEVEPDRVVGWAERAFQIDSREWFVHSLGLALYRAGRYDEAIALLERWNGSGWQPIGYLQNDAVLAMAHGAKGTQPGRENLSAKSTHGAARPRPNPTSTTSAPRPWTGYTFRYCIARAGG